MYLFDGFVCQGRELIERPGLGRERGVGGMGEERMGGEEGGAIQEK